MHTPGGITAVMKNFCIIAYDTHCSIPDILLYLSTVSFRYTMHVFINAKNWNANAMDAHLCSTILSRAFDMSIF